MRRKFKAGQPQTEEVISSLEHLYGLGLEGKGINLPVNKGQRARLAEMIYRERFRGEPLLVVSPVCPDYSYHLDYSSKQYIYDFKKLNGGVSLNASSLLQKEPELVEALGAYGVGKINYLMVMADVEADDPEILASVNLGRNEFLRKVGLSAQAILGETDEGLGTGVEVEMMSVFFEAEDYVRAEAALSQVSASTIAGIAQDRAALYSRWFGSGNDILELNELCRRRAKLDLGKYLIFGMAARRSNVLVLEATAPKIAGLYNFGDGRVAAADLPPLPPTPVVMIENDY